MSSLKELAAAIGNRRFYAGHGYYPDELITYRQYLVAQAMACAPWGVSPDEAAREALGRAEAVLLLLAAREALGRAEAALLLPAERNSPR